MVSNPGEEGEKKIKFRVILWNSYLLIAEKILWEINVNTIESIQFFLLQNM